METSVARHQNGLLSGADACADRRPHAVTHRAESAAGNKGARLFETAVLRRPHLVLADVRRHRRVRIRERGKRGQNFICRQGRIEVRRFVFAVCRHFFEPFTVLGLVKLCQQCLEDFVDIRHDR